MDPLAIAGLGLGVIGGIGSIFGARKSNRQLEQLMKSNPQYQANPIANQRMGLAQTLLNARAPGAAAAERNIYQNQANMQGQVNRNATDASQAMAMAAAGQGQSNQAFGNLQSAEAQDYQRRYGNLEGAQQGVIQEGDKVFQDSIRRFQDTAQIKGMQNQNRQNAWNSLSNLGFGAMSLGMSGGSQSLFGGGGGQKSTPYYDQERTMRGRALNMPLAQY